MSWRFNRLLGYWYALYNSPTAPEQALEPAIARLGERYRAQHLFNGYGHIADFALLDRKVTIEVDGSSHSKPEQKEKDLIHTMKLMRAGWRVVRVTNEQALADPEGTVAAALRSLQSPQRAIEDYQADLDQLHRDYPRLLAAAAKKAKRLAPRRKAAAKKTAAARKQKAAK